MLGDEIQTPEILRRLERLETELGRARKIADGTLNATRAIGLLAYLTLAAVKASATGEGFDPRVTGEKALDYMWAAIEAGMKIGREVDAALDAGQRERAAERAMLEMLKRVTGES